MRKFIGESEVSALVRVRTDIHQEGVLCLVNRFYVHFTISTKQQELGDSNFQLFTPDGLAKIKFLPRALCNTEMRVDIEWDRNYEMDTAGLWK